METKRVIELKNMSIYQGEVSRKANAENNLVLSNVNLTVDEGEFVYLIGRVGTGKSTLLKTLYAEVDLVEGEATVVGFDLRNIKRLAELGVDSAILGKSLYARAFTLEEALEVSR